MSIEGSDSDQRVVRPPLALAATAILAGACSVVLWGALGPFAGMLWSMACVFLGAMVRWDVAARQPKAEK